MVSKKHLTVLKVLVKCYSELSFLGQIQLFCIIIQHDNCIYIMILSNLFFHFSQCGISLVRRV